ncbi:hypothetical protein JOD62_001294 [Microbacterium keratanolyticum]|uniref:Uncharacterized protein n=1 Tax=Microbacterium keratanolyticum TaxID=67574 RepID=A0A9W6HQ15_9MICO|nr:hypothetical protein [Microbacterium keratanolyticum]MBM7468746.1 hypothetical protein [Microbacterium keratanolyticum]GLK00822.1 hypothetical protein GCM10017596_05370 [Microbacterium keratanolyticum]
MKFPRWTTLGAAVLASALAVGTAVPAAAAPGGPRPMTLTWEDRLDEIATGIITEVDAFQDAMFERTPVVTSRRLMSVVAHELAEHSDPTAAWEALQLVFDHQTMEPSHPDYGAMPQDIWGNCWYGVECYQFSVAPSTPTVAGASSLISRTVDLDAGPHVLSFDVKDSVTAVQANYHLFQALVDGQVVWERDVSGGTTDWEHVSVDVSSALSGSTSTTVSFRLLEKRGVTNFPVKVSVDSMTLTGSPIADDAPGAWTPSQTGAGVGVAVVANGTPEINATSFSLLLGAGILNAPQYFTQFTAAQQQTIRERFVLASRSTADASHAQLGYTNARLLRDVQMILVGQGAGDTALYQDGVDRWRDWLDYTREWGIREYGSTVYYGIDLGALMMGYGYVQDPVVREEFRKALDFFWYDIAANYLPGRETMAGSSAREYDWTHSNGPAYFLRVEDWRTRPLDSYSVFNYQVLVSYRGLVYHPSPAHRTMALASPKIVEAKTDPNRFLDRYTYIENGRAMGSTSESFTNVIPGMGAPTPYDKAISISAVGSDPTVGTVSFVPSAGTDPYGKTYSGSAPLHAPLYPVTVQKGGELLTQLDLRPAGVRTASFETNILIPSVAEAVLVDGNVVDTSVVGETPATLTSTVTMWEGDSCVAVRVLRADGIDGHTVQAAFVVDQPGLDVGMARLALTQFESATRTALVADRAAVTLYARTGPCASFAEAQTFASQTALAKISQQQSATVHSSAVTTPGGDLLQVGTDIVAREQLFRKVNGVAVLAPSILTVNGFDYSTVLD